MVASYSPHRHHGETATLFNHPTSQSPSRHLLRSPSTCSSPFAVSLSNSIRTRSASRRSTPVKHRNGAIIEVGSPVKFPLALSTSNEINSPKMTLRSGSSSPGTSSTAQRSPRSLSLCSPTTSRGSSPLKRSEEAANLSMDQVSRGSPVAKKRTGNFALHTSSDRERPSFGLPSFGSPSAFESGPFSLSPSNAQSTTPTRSNSFKNSNNSGHIFEKPTFVRARPQARQQLDFSTASDTTSRMRRVTSVENFLAPRESPFNGRKAPLPSASSHFQTAPHPLSKSVQTTIAGAPPPPPQSSVIDWETPQNYRNAKPNPAAFHSTGFVSKRGRMNSDANDGSKSTMQPDTPCKRTNHFPGSAFQQPKRDSGARIPMGELGSPQTPVPVRSSGGFPNLDRRDSISTDDSDEMDIYRAGDNDSLPPTPTKQPHSDSDDNVFTMNKRLRMDDSAHRPSLYGKFNMPPQTPAPKESSVIPPDPSSLSISGKAYVPNKRHSMPLFPVTPAKELFTNKNKNNSMSKAMFGSMGFPDTPYPRQVDTKTRDYSRFASRFSGCEQIGAGAFSEVWKVVEKRAAPSPAFVFGTPSNAQHLSTPGGLNPLYSSPRDHEEKPKVWAVKRSKARFLGEKDRAKQMEEARILRALGKHPHIVEFVSSWEEDDHLCIQTEYCEGGTLSGWLTVNGNNGRVDEFRVWKIALELCLGLQHIHSHGFMHLDLKPANILIDSSGSLKICDFGMASNISFIRGSEDREGDRQYIAPEVLSESKYSPAVDIFSLGLTLIEAAGNEALPENGDEWHALRRGDLSVAPVLSTGLSGELVHRDQHGNASVTEVLQQDGNTAPLSEEQRRVERSNRMEFIKSIPGSQLHTPRPGDLVNPPEFMAEAALDDLVRHMICEDPKERPSATELLEREEFKWVAHRRQAPATIFEGLWGPDDATVAGEDKDWDMEL